MVFLAITFRRLLCFFFGHRFEAEQHEGLLLTVCARCRKAVGARALKYTLRRNVTRGEIERRMAENPPDGYRFIDCNWKKRKAKFANASGALKFVSF
jgi:hypothetical protein